MINKEKCSNWCKAMLSLMSATKELSDDEAEYIKQNLQIAFAQSKIEELEAKDEQVQKQKSNSR